MDVLSKRKKWYFPIYVNEDLVINLNTSLNSFLAVLCFWLRCRIRWFFWTWKYFHFGSLVENRFIIISFLWYFLLIDHSLLDAVDLFSYFINFVVVLLVNWIHFSQPGLNYFSCNPLKSRLNYASSTTYFASCEDFPPPPPLFSMTKVRHS